MKAARSYIGKDIRIEIVPDPVAERGQLLIRVRAAGICGSDVHFFKEELVPPKVPRVLGHELAGEVVALGEGVTRFRVGQRVVVEPLLTCGECGYCLSGDYYLCPQLSHIGYVHSGGFAELTVAPENKVLPLPDSVSYEAATMLDSMACATHALSRVPVPVGADVVVVGTGAIGIAFAQMAKIAGGNVAVVGRRDAALALARDIVGDIKTISSANVDPVKVVLDWTDGRGAHIVYECVGGMSQLVQLCIHMAARGGTVGVEGVFPEAQCFDARDLMRREVSIVGICSYGRRFDRSEFEITLKLLASGHLKADALITHRVPLDRIVEGFELASNHAESGAIKVAVLP